MLVHLALDSAEKMDLFLELKGRLRTVRNTFSVAEGRRGGPKSAFMPFSRSALNDNPNFREKIMKKFKKLKKIKKNLKKIKKI